MCSTGTAGAQPTSQTFSFTDAAQSFTVPENVCQIAVDAFGAEGGDGDLDNTVRGVGGLGGETFGSLSVTPGETLSVTVGGAGGNGTGGPRAVRGRLVSLSRAATSHRSGAAEPRRR